MSEQTRPALIALPRPTLHRPVIFLALVLFVPDLWLVMNRNLSVQTALLRFIGALLVSWVAAWIVFATVRSFSTPVSSAAGASAPASTGVDPGSAAGLGTAAVDGRPADGATSMPLASPSTTG